MPANEPETSIADDVVALIPSLRIFARSLCGDRGEADELVQETLLKALSSIHTFERGSKLRAWLSTIMRNTFYTNMKRRARERVGSAECVAGSATSLPSQEWSLKGNEFFRALERLSARYRDPFMLTQVLGASYQEAAAICGCEVGTVKSRVNRARMRILEELDLDDLSDTSFQYTQPVAHRGMDASQQ